MFNDIAAGRLLSFKVELRVESPSLWCMIKDVIMQN